MPVIAQIFAGLAAALHVVIFLMESVLWTNPKVYTRFGLSSAQDAATTKPLAYNQGFYNLFLAIGIAVGLATLSKGGAPVVAFALLAIVGAALVLASTGRVYLRGALLQSGFAVAALLLWALLPV